ncbi:MAG: DNA translocase FtsK 4TM domain-containing protein [Bacteroidia bacterium]|jgi:S-DNA-T family DNA segregation ATPase FtsK/SpoIIIE
MSVKANRIKTEENKSKEQVTDKKTKKPKASGVFDFFKSESFIRITGLFLLIVSLFLIFSFTSHVFNWENDYDKVKDVPWYKLISDSKNEVQNRMGELGAFASYILINKWFGISSFLIAFCLFIMGFKMFFAFNLLPIKKTLFYSLFCLIFLSTGTALIFANDLVYGGFGFHLKEYLTSVIGVPGTAFVLVFGLIVFLMLEFKFSFKIPEKKLAVVPPPAVEESSMNKLRPEVTILNAEDENDEFEEDENETDLENGSEEETPFVLEVEGHLADHESATEGMPALEILEPIKDPEIDDLDASEHQMLSEEEKERMNLTDILSENEDFDVEAYDPTKDLSNYKFPDPDLLDNHGSNKARVDKAELEANSNRIIDTLKSYGIEIAKISASIGPTVTLYEIIPAAGVRISKIKNLEDDIALSLSALGIRIIAPMPGKGTIGIEVPNQHPEIVAMKTLITSEKFTATTMDLPVALGKTISNENFVADLAKMPHLLMAGATGQGKSVGLNAILVSLLYKKHPAQIKFVLVDPKKVELTLFSKIERHFLAKLPNNEEAIITDVKKVVYTLNSLCVLMDQRYELLKIAMVRNIKDYNAKFLERKLNPKLGHHFMPYIVLVVDEFADLIMTAGKEVELPIARLAQLARAIGIHLIIATQRPSVNIITGTIKANFPARVAFRVTSKIDSRTILDSGGADQLIGRGDLLFSTGSDLIRLQCPFVDTPEVDRICDFIGSQQGYASAFILPEYIDENAEPEDDFDIGDRDVMFAESAKIVVMHQQGSASLLQRKLKLGYNRAGRIIDQLEKAGIIGPFEGSKARKVIFKDLVSLEQFLNDQNS